MIELERHIEILLLDNDCVIVPGLGGFMAHHVEARYDERGNMFLPPLRTLGFNPKLDMNDSLLAQSYVEAYDISYPEALNRIDADVDEIRRTLETEGRYELDNIGVLYLNADGNYEFEPCESGVLTPEYYGLSEVEIDSVVADGATGEGKVVPINPSAAVPAVGTSVFSGVGSQSGNAGAGVAAAGEQSAADGAKDGSSDGDRVISVKVSVLRNIVAVACAVVAFFMLATPISNSTYVDGKKMGGVGNGLLYNLIPKDGGVQDMSLAAGKASAGVGTSADKCRKALPEKTESAVAGSRDGSKTVELKGENNSPKSEASVAANGKSDDNVALQKGNYCIVLACRITKSNAEAFAERLRSKGYGKVRLVDGNGNSLKVVYGDYPSEDKALNELRGLRDNEIFKEAWVYCVK